ncbi:hypothetical protein [Streptomyces mirabilis]|uniref:hypothetical protein n=1 Tax=Streptomyces mirabilis TaxID=68239 RepID=UPI00339EFFC6
MTVNQSLSVALADSYAEATGCAEVNLCTAVSLRRRYEESAELPDVGCFINVLNVPVRVGRGDPADEARDYAAAPARADAAWRPPLRDHAVIRRAVKETAAARSAAGICITSVGAPALGPHTARVTGYRTVVNRVGANYGVVLHLGTLGGAFTTALAFGTPNTDPATVRAVAKALRDRMLRPAPPRRAGVCRRGLPDEVFRPCPQCPQRPRSPRCPRRAGPGRGGRGSARRTRRGAAG